MDETPKTLKDYIILFRYPCLVLEVLFFPKSSQLLVYTMDHDTHVFYIHCHVLSMTSTQNNDSMFLTYEQKIN